MEYKDYKIENGVRKMTTSMLGEDAYTLKHIEYNTGIKVDKLRRDIRKGMLKAYGSYEYYVIQSDLDKYLWITGYSLKGCRG